MFFCRFAKHVAEILVETMAEFCDLSIKVNNFPKRCNIAKVEPLFSKKFEN